MWIQGARYTLLLSVVAFGFISVAAYYFFKPMPHKITYLALGDSYTIGAHVKYDENYPNQVVAYLRSQNIDVGEPVFIAHSGWTSDDLYKAVRRRNLTDTFTFVTLLIGANNQFRGLSLDTYRQQFGELLTKAIGYVNGHTERVFVLSVPDWSASPPAAGLNRQRISEQVATYNSIIKEMTLGNTCQYIDISGLLKGHADDASYFLDDFIHPSGKGYALWAAKLAPVVSNTLKRL